MAKKILVVGGGGREHAIIKALKKSPDCGEVWCAPGNGGIGYDAHCVNIKATDVETMVGFAETEKFDYVVVAQDDPLALGMVDALEAVGIPAFGPDKAAARIEASKVFSKDLMKKYGIPTAKYETFDDPAKVMEYIKAEGKYPVVIKADGLALGKGVLICENEEQAAEGVKEIMLDKKFGASGNHVVVEEFLTGPEVSVLSFTDGKVVKPMVSSMDHKRANDHDTGLNTGGMGTVAPNPYYTPAIAAECMEKIFLPTIKAMNAEGCPFKGCLYFGGDGMLHLQGSLGVQRSLAGLHRIDDVFLDLSHLLIGQGAFQQVDAGRAHQRTVALADELDALGGRVGALVELAGQILHGERHAVGDRQLCIGVIHRRLTEHGGDALLEQSLVDALHVVAVEQTQTVQLLDAQQRDELIAQALGLAVEAGFLFNIDTIYHWEIPLVISLFQSFIGIRAKASPLGRGGIAKQ